VTRRFALGGGVLGLQFQVMNVYGRANTCCVSDLQYQPLPDGSVRVDRIEGHWPRQLPVFASPSSSKTRRNLRLDCGLLLPPGGRRRGEEAVLERGIPGARLLGARLEQQPRGAVIVQRVAVLERDVDALVLSGGRRR